MLAGLKLPRYAPTKMKFVPVHAVFTSTNTHWVERAVLITVY
jgi:hypothetical protein